MATVIESTTTRQFLDWNTPPLPGAAKWLADAHADDDALDLGQTILVVPGARAGRRLLELLLEESESRQLIFSPPHVTTLGSFPELIYRPQRPLANNLEQLLAYVTALRETPRKELAAFTSNPPRDDDPVGWMSLAKVLLTWHTELSGNALDFKHVLEIGESNSDFVEKSRWRILTEVQRRYLDHLNQLQLWDRQTARLVALDHAECQTDKQIYLVGTVDLNKIVREMIMQVAQNVTCLIFADADQEHCFDSLGCLEMEYWQTRRLEIPDEWIRLADQPSDQARIATEFLHGLDGRYGIDDVTIAVPDRKMVSHLNRSLSEFEIETFDEGGMTILQTRPLGLLTSIANWIDGERYEDFAELVRHPDLFAWVGHQVGSQTWIRELDLYQNDRLPFFIPTDSQRAYFEGRDRHGKPKYAYLKRVHALLAELLQPLMGPPRPLCEWAEPWRRILEIVYQRCILQRDNPAHQRMIGACQIVVRCLIEIEQSESAASTVVSNVEAIAWVTTLAGESQVFDPRPADSISLVGWLDAPLDDAQVAIITNVNDGLIPSTENSSLFLPNSIRTRLGLLDNRRRYARDAYALSLLLHSREKLLLICGRRDNDQQPIYPSRLLFGGDVSQLPARSLRLFGDGEVTTNWSLETSDWRPTQQQFAIPQPPSDLPPTERMRVTDFKNYIQCPYRFYLTRVLGLERTDDQSNELDGAKFGSLVHDVLENFGRSGFNDSTQVDEIQQYLLDYLNSIAFARYGKRPMPAVQIQLEQARTRLKAFAQWQAKHRGEGWTIHEVERENCRYEFDVDGQPFEVRGQIDRVDVNLDAGRIGLYDYKSSDAPKGPREYHQYKKEWKDLQLPLYRWLLKGFDLPDDFAVELGLILISKDTSKISLYRADWTEEELKSADEKAFEVMRDVRANKFWPPTTSHLPPYLDDLGPICQSDVFERWTPSEAREGG